MQEREARCLKADLNSLKNDNVGKDRLMEKREIIIIGGGPAGMAAALKLEEMSFRDVMILEKENDTGGVLRQCIHPGFGLIKFGKNHTGPEYKAVYEKMIAEQGIEVMTGTTVMSVQSAATWCMENPEKAEQERISPINREVMIGAQTPEGFREFRADAVILASGCRERGRGFLGIPGTRPAGIYTAGTAQGLMNLRNIKVGNRIVIIGSGDIGLIMARRFRLEGSKVVCVIEKEAVCGGLERNRRECLEDFGIPLYTSSQVCNISGKKRVESVTVRDSEGNETVYECDTIILSAGLVPEDGMAEKNLENLFYCGNALYVHDLVDEVSICGEDVAIDVAGYLLARMRGKNSESRYSGTEVENLRRERRAFVAERRKNRIEQKNDADRFIVCTQCPNGCRIDRISFTGGKCSKGEAYARQEMIDPARILTSTVKIEGTDRLVSVRTEEAIPRSILMEGMNAVNSVIIKKQVKISDVIIENFAGTGTDLIATASSKMDEK